MAVWLARTESAARPVPFPTLASMSKASASSDGVRPDVRALNDQREPASSGDHANRYLHWWPHKGTKEWVQYDFAKPAKVSAVEIYWFDDTGVGECRLPKSWELSYRENGEWKPVQNPSGFGCEADKYNRTTFEPVETDALRLEVQLPELFSAGIHECELCRFNAEVTQPLGHLIVAHHWLWRFVLTCGNGIKLAAKFARTHHAHAGSGKFADMVILDADPLRDVSNLRRIFKVIKAGQVVDVSQNALK